MAEIVISAFLAVAFEKLASTALKKLARSEGIQSQLKKWERLLSHLHDLLDDASQKEITNRSVKRWLNSLQHLAYDIDDILDDLATEAMHRELTQESGATTSKVRKLIPTCCTSYSLSTRMHGKLNKITIKLQDLVEENNTLGLTVKDGRSRITNRRSQTSLVDSSSIVGRQKDKDALLQKLMAGEPCKENFSILPIVGMGGVGKTTLARLLYDEKQVKEHFELKAWVCVSDEFDIFNISNIIYQSIAGENKEFKDLNLLQVALNEKLSMKRFLLVLDDVWSESYADWEILARPFLVGAPGSKVIITTRKLSLLTQLGYAEPYRLSLLSQGDALSLFCRHALDVNNFDLHPKLRQHGEGIVKKCDGLPLALIALGRLLRTKTDEEEWEELLNSEIWRLDKGDVIVPALRLSYHDLSASLKQLFAYCSLFPKDYVFDKEELILLWMAEGFLHQSSSKSMERLGHEYFAELLSRSFFQQAPNEESLYVMHDLMNDLATSVAGDFFFRLDNETEKDVKKEAMEKYRHMSFVREEYIVYKKFMGFERAKSLRTFLSVSFKVKRWWQNFYFSNKILVNLLLELPLLRVLCLADYEISEVPESIGNLKHLRYLNLSRTRIMHLPENICNLYNLQTLIVSGCRSLKELPNSFIKLKNLRHFDITGTPLLNKMPLGISELKSLQTLTKIIIGGNNGYAITELKNLKNLQGKFYITGLDQVQTAMHAEESCLLEKRFTELKLEWNDVFDGSRKETLDMNVLNLLKPHQDNLRKLKIVSYGGMDFPNWVGDPSFHRLTYVSIRNCKKCISLPPLGQLPSLKKLFIQGMDHVKVVGSELLGTSVSFPSLEILSFRDMQVWEVWSTNHGVVDTVFPCLRELSIDDCPNLVNVSVKAVATLNTLKIIGCGHTVLTSLVKVAPSISMLEMWHISELTDELWGGVIKNLGNVEEVRINWCNEIRYLWESEVEASEVLVNLRKLVICECEKLESLGEKDEEDNCESSLTSLRILEVSFCKSMECCSCPGSIETLNISSCPSVTSVFFPTGGGQKLKSLTIDDCQNLSEKELVGGEGGEKTRMLSSTTMPILEDLQISYWPDLKSIINLSYFIHLTELVIEDCPKMESFPDHELPNLTLLKLLMIKNCPSIDASFPRGIWPPKLCTLRIGQLKKHILEWGPQNFPTSLVDLTIWGRSSEDVSSSSQLSHLLPSCLTSLGINGFDKLESLSTELQHLTSLQHLFIHKCPKIIHLPKTLLPSLLSLDISGCPTLNERITRKGSYRRLISGIPSVTTI